MKAANLPIQRRASAKLLIVDGRRMIAHRPRSDFADLLHAGDLVIANDAATLPASLAGWHERTGRGIEVRLAGRNTFGFDEFRQFSAVVFGLGDFRMRTEDRPAPPAFAHGDRLRLGLLRATVMDVLNHPRLILLEFDGTPAEIWEGLARHGRPIQYSHVPLPLAIWDTWTPIAGPPVAFEPPSAGFVLDWKTLSSMKARGVQFADHHSCSRHLFYRRSTVGCSAPLRRAVRYSGIDRQSPRRSANEGRTHHRRRYHRRTRAGALRRDLRRQCSMGRREGHQPHRPAQRDSGSGCDRLRHT